MRKLKPLCTIKEAMLQKSITHNMMAMKLNFSYTFLLCLLLAACSKPSNEETPKPDPCKVEEAQPLKAAFKIEESVGDSLVITDTVMRYSGVRFTALGKYDSVKWKIGGDVRLFRTLSVYLEFDYPETVKITLIGYRKPNKACFPTDDGVDTVSRNLVVLPFYQSKIKGVYRGYVTGKEQDVFEVAIDTMTAKRGTEEFFSYVGLPPRYYVSNLPKGVENTPSFRYALSDGRTGGTSFILNQRGYFECQNRILFGYLSPDSRTLTIDYTIKESNDPVTFAQIRSKPMRFIGRRIR
jgi:hypothetical protein